VRFFLAGTLAVFLAGCAQLKQQYVRTDGSPIDNAQQQSALAQCKGEAALATANVTPENDPFHQRETTVVNACMARNGYIRSQQ
jgi:hypothetical protein